MMTRELLQIVEIDVDYCTETYGTLPCTASLSADPPRKCFNTFATCQDTANFDKGTKTLSFALSQSGLPKGERIYPALAKPVTTSPTVINLGGVSKRRGPMGQRARVTVELMDFADNDAWFDKYQAQRVSGAAQHSAVGYEPRDKGTFFGRLRTRFPYYVGRALRVREGYVGDTIASMRTRNYVITEWKGPDAKGRIVITASDILDIADNEKALCPAPNEGELASDILTGLISFDLSPAGIGATYETSGFASIGSELVSFTRSSDTITLTGRGLKNTTEATHSEGDLFQEAYRANGDAVADVAYDWLVNFAGVDSSFITLADWQAEGTRWLAGFDLDGYVLKPTGVLKLLGELAQLGVMWWWDDTAQKIKMRANRPVDDGETIPAFAAADDVLADSVSIKDLHEKRLTQVMFYHGQVDPTKGLEDESNYDRVVLDYDASAGGVNEYNQDKILRIFCRWLGAGNTSVASTVASRLNNRFRNIPREMVFSYDVDRVNDIDLASPISITTRHIQDDAGDPVATQMQITSIEEKVPGHVLEAVAETYTFDGRYGFITENSRVDYASSSDAEKAKGTYIVGATLTFGDGTGPYLMF